MPCARRMGPHHGFRGAGADHCWPDCKRTGQPRQTSWMEFMARMQAHRTAQACLMDGVDAACVEEDALREGGLPRVDVRADAYVAEVAQLVGLLLDLGWLGAEVPAMVSAQHSQIMVSVHLSFELSAGSRDWFNTRLRVNCLLIQCLA